MKLVQLFLLIALVSASLESFAADGDGSRWIRLSGTTSTGQPAAIPDSVDVPATMSMAQYLGKDDPIWAGMKLNFRLFIPETHLLAGDSPKYADNIRYVFDEILQQILITPPGERVLSDILRCDPATMSNQLALSPSAAEALVSRCAKPSLSLPPIPPIDSPVPSRVFGLALTPKESSEYDAYSDGYGVTRIILAYRDFDTEHLTRILAHEMAVQFDGKAFFDPQWLGSFGDEFRVEVPAGISGWKSIAKAYAREPIFAVPANPILNEALIAYRAFRFEQAVMDAEGANQKLPLGEPSDEARCLAVTREIAESLTQWPLETWNARTNQIPVSGNDALVGRPVELSRVTQSEIREKSPAEVLRGRRAELDRVLTRFADGTVRVNGRKQSFCEFFSTPLLSSKNLVFSSGPRPAIGGW